MSVEIYQITAPVFIHNLKNLSAILKKPPPRPSHVA